VTNTCIRCGRPMADTAFACAPCGVDRPARQLHLIAETAPAARDVAQRQVKWGDAGGGASEIALLINLAAMQRLDEVQNTLTTWARHISETRGVPLPDERAA
jgi:hypothetical protein